MIYATDGDNFFAITDDAVFKLEDDQWEKMACSPSMLERFVPGLEEVEASEVPVPFAVARKFAAIMKSNPYRDANGQFTDKDSAVTVIDYSTVPLPKEGLPHEKLLPHERVDPFEIEGYNEEKFWNNFGDKTTPQELLHTLFGEDIETKKLDISANDNVWKVTGYEGAKVYGQPVEWYERKFEMSKGEVSHDYLKFPPGSSGAGVAKELFANSLSLYDKMDLKAVRVHAALEMGAYTWSKYGFEYDSEESRKAHINGFPGDSAPSLKSNLDRLIRDNAGPLWKLSAEEMEEYNLIQEAFKKTGDMKMNQHLADLDTPHLNKLVSHIKEDFLDENSPFVKHLFYNTHWTGVLPLDKNSPNRQRCDEYIKKGRKPKAKKSAFDKLEPTGYSSIMKSTPKTRPAGGDMCDTGADGKPTNGAIMLAMLGDEPDTSEISSKTAKAAGYSKEFLAALRK